jgi:hypothetical protein
VGEALAALARTRGVPLGVVPLGVPLAWGGATRAVAAAARDEERLGSEDADVERNEGGDVAATDAVADARAGVAWPALVRDPRPAITRMTAADSAAEDTDVGAPEARPRGFIVGGCACRDRVAAVVHGALAASDTALFLDEDRDGDGDGTAARRLSADHRAGATALAVLACAPRAHECALGAGRFARLLGRASWTLRLRDALANAFAESSDASASDPRASFPAATSDTTSPSFFFVPDATESDACLALWLERSAVALADARARWEPREAAEAATELAAAAATTARAALGSHFLQTKRLSGDGPGGAPGAGAGAGAGASRDARGGSDRLRAARRVMLRRARETLDECLVAVGVLEERGGGENATV